MNCPCCNQAMRFNQWEKYYVCQCQGKLLELADLEIIAKNKTAPADCPIVNPHQNAPTHAAGITVSPQAIGSINPTTVTVFHTIKIAKPSNPAFLQNNNYYFDMHSRVWFKKVKDSNLAYEKQVLDNASVNYEVEAA